MTPPRKRHRQQGEPLLGKTPIADTGCTALGAKAEDIIGFFSVKEPEDDEKIPVKINNKRPISIEITSFQARFVGKISE
nr:hypothetical protein [Enterococcus innesii]